MHWEFPVTSVRGHNFASERHYPECPGGHSLIKVTGGGSDTDFLPGAVTAVKNATWSRNTKSHIWRPGAGMIPHFDSPRANRSNNYDLEWIKA